jgi:hypothetical protein
MKSTILIAAFLVVGGVAYALWPVVLTIIYSDFELKSKILL